MRALPLVLTGSIAMAGCSPEPAKVTPPGAELLLGRCTYASAISQREECREYVGAKWTTEAATADCNGVQGTLAMGAACSYPAVLGRCIEDGASEQVTRIVIPGSESTQCAPAKRDCVVYVGGVFVADAACSEALPADAAPSGLPIYELPTRVCVAPKPGEPAGKGPNGTVCTWSAIAAATEEGRKFGDYASCRTVLTQRPYYPAPPHPAPAEPDPRLNDPAYVAELTWVRGQIESAACVCCHSKLAPRGPANWLIDGPGNFMSSFYDTGLALGAGWVDSAALGVFPAAENNGFAREVGFPSTDRDRITAFFAAELQYRGKTRADFANTPPFGGPLVAQLDYQPTACAPGVGIDANGTITWAGGPARYLYVLAAGSPNPTVPPNLDLPPGTIWRIDVPFDGKPIRSGITYGVLPAGVTQHVPANGAPAALVAGTTYYLNVMADIAAPITRCLFTR